MPPSWQSNPRSALIINIVCVFLFYSSLFSLLVARTSFGRLKTPGHRSVVMGYVRGSISSHCHNLYSVPCCGAAVTFCGVTGFFLLPSEAAELWGHFRHEKDIHVKG